MCLFMCLSHLYIFGQYLLFRSSAAHLQNQLFVFDTELSEIFLYILAINLLFDVSFANIISHRWSFPFICKVFCLIYHHLLILLLFSWPEETYLKYIANSSAKKHPVCIFFCFMFSRLWHSSFKNPFQFISVYSVKKSHPFYYFACIV